MGEERVTIAYGTVQSEHCYSDCTFVARDRRGMYVKARPAGNPCAAARGRVRYEWGSLCRTASRISAVSSLAESAGGLRVWMEQRRVVRRPFPERLQLPAVLLQLLTMGDMFQQINRMPIQRGVLLEEPLVLGFQAHPFRVKSPPAIERRIV